MTRISTVLSALLFVSLGACGGSGEGGGDDTGPATNPDDTAALEPLGDPCELVIDAVAATLGWSGGTGPFPNQFNDDDLQSCDYVGDGTDGRLQITLTRYDADAIERGFLEGAFDDYLAGAYGDLTWAPVADGLGDETLYGTGMEGPNQIYHLVYRYGNHTQVSLRHLGIESRDAASTQTALLALADNL